MIVLNRTTKELVTQAYLPQYPLASWIRNPDLSAVAGQPAKYWIITGDVVTLMDAAARTAADAAELEANRTAAVAQLQRTEDVLRAFMLLVLDELNAHANKINAILTAIDTSTNYATLKANIVAITDYPQRTEAQLRTAIRNKLGT